MIKTKYVISIYDQTWSFILDRRKYIILLDYYDIIFFFFGKYHDLIFIISFTQFLFIFNNFSHLIKI
jgi:hypothetical protein